eukprot:CAMPEP_0168378806 /NCGR_PEP_ID=MMETSP0228-20121227/11522_1 /TAXON_ID=133427 /ORGANISM="Protoceratium reticulatum, Strain CCCM 535 (=CCMP 1889)" /LENGTH=38 /DNA_ID= /DNA_START= /DNA_END= /DNA_ORIENTATION=
MPPMLAEGQRCLSVQEPQVSLPGKAQGQLELVNHHDHD